MTKKLTAADLDRFATDPDTDWPSWLWRNRSELIRLARLGLEAEKMEAYEHNKEHHRRGCCDD